MEEKILAKLEKIDSKFDLIDKRFDELETKIDEKLDKRFAEFEIKMDEKLDKRFIEFEVKFDGKLKDLKHELEINFDNKLQQALQENNEKILERVEKKILDHMFLFEEQYGRKLTIAVEALTYNYQKENIQDESIMNLERVSQMNSAYIYNHEDRLDKLEVLSS